MKDEQGYSFDAERLIEVATTFGNSYRSAEPFQHVVVDDFCPDPGLLDQVFAEFPPASNVSWVAHESRHSCKKRGHNDMMSMGKNTLDLLLQCNAKPFVDFLELLTGLDGLIPDPHLEGGGLHETPIGGYLNIHVDFNRQARMRLDRRLNVLLFLNRDWKDEYGGHLELWDDTGQRRVKRIAPKFNRLVVFSTTEDSYHGHPEPVACPHGVSRRSLALNYYTNGRPIDGLAAPHLTRWAL